MTEAPGGMENAPEAEASRPEGLPEAPDCPHCGGLRTRLASLFGSHASLATYWCDDCRSPFEVLRWRPAAAPAGTSQNRSS